MRAETIFMTNKELIKLEITQKIQSKHITQQQVFPRLCTRQKLFEDKKLAKIAIDRVGNQSSRYILEQISWLEITLNHFLNWNKARISFLMQIFETRYLIGSWKLINEDFFSLRLDFYTDCWSVDLLVIV